MKRKIVKRFVDIGCGFPVVLRHVPMIQIQGKWVPDINYNDLEKTVLIALCYKPYKLTGNEIRFIRLYFQMTLQQFAKRFGVEHPTIIKWENFGNIPTKMTLGTEKDIRLFIVDQIFGMKEVGKVYREFEQIHFEVDHPEMLEVDIERLAS